MGQGRVSTRKEFTKAAATPMQIGLLYESSLTAKPWVNLEQIVLQLGAGSLTPAQIKDAWQVVAQNHDSLRASFLPADADGVQVQIHAEAGFGFDQIDLSQLSPQAAALSLAQFLDADRLRGADPLAYPNWRVTCLDRGAMGMTLVWTIHHALIDGAGMETVLTDLHRALVGHSLPASPALADYLTQLDRQSKEACRTYFQNELSSPSVGSGIFAAPSATLSRAARHLLRLDAVTSDALRNLARQSAATPLNVVQAAWAMLLSRWSGQSAARFGLVESGRGLVPGFEGTVGCLISTLPLQVQLQSSDRVGSFLAGLRHKTLAMRAHSHTDLGDIRRWIGSPGDMALFETIVMYTRGSLEARLLADGAAPLFQSVRLLEEGSAPATLAVYGDAEMLVELEYDPARLPQAQAGQIFGHLIGLFRAMAAAGPDTPLGALNMLAPTETAELLALARPADPAPLDAPCIATRFEAIAARQPGAVAIVDAASDQQLSYHDLDASANFLAHSLANQGIGLGDVVALHLPRGLDFGIALLAVLKVGAAFLPLDPDQPPALLKDLMANAGAKALIAPQNSALRKAVGLHLVPQAGMRESPPARPVPDANRLAYVIHTSGSTGKPKAVMGLCGALSAHATAAQSAFGLSPTDRVLQFAGLGFDVTLEEIIPTLLSGGAVVLRDDASASSVTGFFDLVTQKGVTVLNLPASFWHVLVDEMTRGPQRLPAAVRLMVTGTERINPTALATWQRLHPDVTWINGYGPTETTITATSFALPPGAALWSPDAGEVPIGRPMGHALCYLRAPDGSLAPKGAEGQLWIGGAAVTGGYIGLIDQTDQVFTPDPWDKGGRVYNSGDLAQWRDDGQLMFLGRRDRQIKLRGHRIDLHQIENQLLALPEVRQVHAALDSDGGVSPRLLAWLVCHDGPSGTDLVEIRRAVAERLPPYMVPSLIAVGRLPVGPNGKIDTRDLPRPMRSLGPDDGTLAGAKDGLASIIAQSMAKVLDLDFVPTDASFFDLGGESLLALRLVSLIEARTGKACRASDLHSHPTPSKLAQMLRGGAQGPRFVVPIQPEGNQPALFAVHVLGNGGELFRPLSAALGPDFPVFGLTVGMPKNLGEIDVQRTARVYFDEVQRHHPSGPISLCAVSMAAYFAFELAQLLREAGREVRVLAVLDAMGPDGRPALRGWAKLRAHLGQFRRRGLRHLSYIRDHRLHQLREMSEARRSDGLEITGFNLIAANVRAVETYVPLPYDGPITIFRAADSFWDSPEAIATGLGWSSVARGGLQLIDLPGDHLSILYPDNVANLALHLRRMIEVSGP